MEERESPGQTRPKAIHSDRLASLLTQHEADLTRFLHGLLRDPELVRDALQSTFAKVVEHGHTARTESLRGWLFQVAYHEAMTIRRKQALEARARKRVEPGSVAGEPGPDVLAIRAEDVGRVRQALDQLPPEQRSVVRARIYDGKTFAEIARDQRVPLGTVLTRMRLALRRLSHTLESERKRGQEGDR